MKKINPLILLALIGILILSLACSIADNGLDLLAAPTDTPIPTHTPKPTHTSIPTRTTVPTRTPKPTNTPNLAATQEYDEILSQVQEYYDEGYLPSLDGRYVEIEDLTEEWAQMEWYDWWIHKVSATNFLLSTHLKWTSASETPELAGCGIVFAIQDDYRNYAVFLDRDRIYFTRSDDYYYEIGKTKGTGRVSYEVSDEADFILIVNERYSYVIVDGKLIGEYTLSQDQPVHGKLGYALMSGTNKDYGTRCEITDTKVWIVDS